MVKFFVHYDWSRKCWEVRSRARGGGDRVIATQLSEHYARRIVRLLNEDEEREALIASG